MKRLFIFVLLSSSLSSFAMDTTSEKTSPSRSWFVKADKAASKAAAFLALQKAGYILNETDLIRKANQETGAGFWDAMISVEGKPSRVICYGPGEYVNPHFHNEEEVFKTTGGGCDFWLLQEKWQYNPIKAGQEIKVPATIVHCLVADDKEGLCMHVARDDSTRSVEFIKELEIPKEQN